MRVQRSVYQAIRTHAEQSNPRECCGVLLGVRSQEAWRVTTYLAAENAPTGSAHNQYRILSVELVRIVVLARRQGLEIAGFHHSHMEQSAQWSQLDLAEAHWTGCLYLITSVLNGKTAETNAYTLLGPEATKHFVQESILIED